MKKALIHYIKNEKNDEVYTPNYAIIPLLKFIKKDLIIWECTDFGDSNITKLFKQNGNKVISTHLKDFDFLNDIANFDFDIIITNPPYSLKDQFIEKCYEYKKPFCLLLPLTSLEGVKRGGLFRKNGIEVLVFDRRINYLGQKKSNWFNSSWFCHNVLPNQLIFEEVQKVAPEKEINCTKEKQYNIYDYLGGEK